MFHKFRNPVFLGIAITIVLALVFAGGASAALLWTHKWDATFVRADLFGASQDGGLHVYGRDNIAPAEGTVVFTRDLSCAGALGARMDTWKPSGADLRVRGVCAPMTPTPAPTQ